jgi:1-acyl-sn-glycerol-3-phosphate acyltransferase
MSTTLENISADAFPLVEPIEKERIIDEYAKITQFLSWPIVFVFFRSFFDLRIEGKENLRNIRSPFIIVSNHISIYDSFWFRLVLGLNTPHLPLRFMAVKKFNWNFLNFLAAIGVVDIIYFLFGVFTIVKGKGLKKNLEEAEWIIKAGGNVVIYPEGKIIKSDEVGPFKNGAALLAQKTGSQVLPISFRLIKGDSFRRKLCVNIGESKDVQVDGKIENITEDLRKAVISLYSKI